MKTQLSKPARSHARYTEEYKKEALELWRASGRSAAKVAAELGIRRVKGLQKQRREITSLRRALPSVDPQNILQRVAKKYGVDRHRLVAPGERSLQAKNVAMWMVWESGSKSLRQIGELFSGFDYAPVAQRIRRTKSTYNSIAARRLITAMLNV